MTTRTFDHQSDLLAPRLQQDQRRGRKSLNSSPKLRPMLMLMMALVFLQAACWLAAANQHYHQQQHSSVSSRPDSDDHIQFKRQASDSQPELVLARRLTRANSQAQHSNETAGNSNRQLHNLWTFLRTIYPNLARHLYHLAVLNANAVDGVAPANSQWPLKASSARAVSRLLNEAELVLQQEEARGHASSSPRAAAAGLLARVSSNPKYAALVQQMRARQMEQRMETLRANLTRQAADSQPPADGHVYGRVVNYPHELRDATASALDKLRIFQQELRRTQGPENNVDQNDRRTNEGAETLRNKFVYGEVRAPASGTHQLEAGNLVNKQLETIDKLHELATLKLPAKSKDDNNNNNNNNDDESSNTHDRHHERNFMQPTNERNPDIDNVSEQQSQSSIPPNRKMMTPSASAREEHGTGDDNFNDDTAEISEPRFPSSNGPQILIVPKDENVDEIKKQQNYHRLASTDEDDNSEEKFEGVFGSGPLQHTQVRMLRSGKKSNGQRTGANNEELDEEQVIVLTTSNPNGIFEVN